MRSYHGRNRQQLHDVHLQVAHGSMLNGVHHERILRTRAAVESILPKDGGKIVELGCSVGDISGPLAEKYEVTGIDINPHSIETAERDYPNGWWTRAQLEDVEPFPCDVLIICEVLEHVANPAALIKAWLPLSKACVISHPIDETDQQATALTMGTHEWSFSREDLENWFAMGGHEIVSVDVLTLDHGSAGKCDTVIATGRRK